ncbi:MAG: hypothetical protein JXR96_08880 [Deltaproteobacteria bacterium]|nr:hypothetical protein [Deltaproteobacteria bacterium]
MRKQIVLLWALVLACGCGAEPGSELGAVSASLRIQQTLAEDLEGVQIYLFQVDKMGNPRDDSLLADTDRFKDYKAEKVESFSYSNTGQAVMDGIPDRGRVWRFYARGLNHNSVLIGHGCTDGLYDMDPEATEPQHVQIDIVPIPL